MKTLRSKVSVYASAWCGLAAAALVLPEVKLSLRSFSLLENAKAAAQSTLSGSVWNSGLTAAITAKQRHKTAAEKLTSGMPIVTPSPDIDPKMVKTADGSLDPKFVVASPLVDGAR